MAKPDAIQPVGRVKKVSMLIHGHSGTGKTRLIGTGGKGTLIVKPPIEHTDSIRSPGAEQWEVTDWDDMWEVHDYLRQGGHQNHDIVCLDSISLFQDSGLDDIFQHAVDRKPSRKEYDLDKGEYGINMARLGRWVRHMVGMPGFDFIVTGHSFAYDDLDGRLWPYIQGKRMPEKICGYMNVVGYLEVKQGKRVMRFGETGDYFAKDQFDAFGKGRMVEPTLPKLMQTIKAARGSTTTTRRKPRRKRSPK